MSVASVRVAVHIFVKVVEVESKMKEIQFHVYSEGPSSLSSPLFLKSHSSLKSLFFVGTN